MEVLQQSVTVLKGVGPKVEEQFLKLHIQTIGDLLWTFPKRHEDYQVTDLAQTGHQEKVTLEGIVEGVPMVTFSGRGKSRLTVTIRTGHYLIKAVFFNQHYLKDRLTLGATVRVTGKWDKGRQSIIVNRFHGEKKEETAPFESVYYLRGIMYPKTFRRFVKEALQYIQPTLGETLPLELLTRYQLPNLLEAFTKMHFPTEEADMKQARRRFAYEELLQFQLRMQIMKKRSKKQGAGLVIPYHLAQLKAFIAALPYELTPAQKRVVNEICADLKSTSRMNRLLQGDVGSGKTVVAAIALYATVTAGYQGALMAPTEILAEQHAESFNEWLTPFGVSIAFLSGSTRVKARKEILHRLSTGEIDLVIGTHALIQPDVQFKQLGLVITDEQHRFGVNQRRILREKGQDPNVLFMTATPIPRTLAITTFGEMDISIIDELPAGRKPIETHWLREEQLPHVLEKMSNELAKGHQAYVICPLIEESETIDVQNAVAIYEQLALYYKGKAKVGLMHGKLTSDEKESVMEAYSAHQLDILVSTTVVEVGVNVPNATFMLIYDATRFGLAQLHQLRGRVGRGNNQSYCVLLADPKTDEGKERMQIMTETNDGFVLAEKDLELRGTGDFFGRKQSGLPEFKVADVVEDYRVLQVAMQDAQQLIQQTGFWKDEKFQALRKNLEQAGVLGEDGFD